MSTCVITGVGSGIGKAVAIELSKRKYYDKFALLGRNEKAIRETIELMKNSGARRISFYSVDLSEPELIPPIIKNINEKERNIIALYNIAGYTDPQPLLSTSLESVELTYKVNVFTPFVLIRECTKYMKSTGGKILNVASTAGMTPRPGWLSYASSKSSVIAM